jgi:thiol-disulfide isomerase/thioredoxin
VASQDREENEQGEGSARDFLRQQLDLFKAGFSFSGFERDLLALNRGDKRYLNISGISGADSVTDGRGAVYADLDNDGDTDIFLRAMHGPAHFLFKNQLGQDSGWLRVTLEGRASGRDAFGAVVRVKSSRGIQTKTKSGGSGFVSQGDPRLLFGLGDDDAAEWIEVTWPSRLSQRFPGAPAGSSLKLVEGATEPVTLTERRYDLPEPLPPGERLWRQLSIERAAPLPDLHLAALDGGGTTLAATVSSGRPALINFWATWCIPCAREMPELERLHATAGPTGLQVIGISLDRPEDRGEIPEFVRRVGVSYPVYTLDAAELERLFVSDAIPIPLSLLVDERGRVQEIFSGWSRELRHAVEPLAAGD